MALNVGKWRFGGAEARTIEEHHGAGLEEDQRKNFFAKLWLCHSPIVEAETATRKAQDV